MPPAGHVRLLLVVVLTARCGAGIADDQSADADPASPTVTLAAAEAEFFEKQVRPLLANHCHKCHGPDEQKGGLRLDLRDNALTGGDTGPAIVPGKPDESLLFGAVSYGDLYQMPPTGKLADADIAILRQWIELGAPWPEVPHPDSAVSAPTFDLAARAKQWAFRPVAHPAIPSISRPPAEPLASIDHFLLARLETAGLSPAPLADRQSLIRRLYFDLVGLPPSPSEVRAFVADDSPDAIARLVDRLLASPHFGERWGRHWLDLVRYAETRGHEFDGIIPNAWQYRDYVIRAFNADVPYDVFITEHLAGDLVRPPRLDAAGQINESILGTGFWFLGEEVHSPVDIRGDEVERIDNKIDCMTKAFLGLTVACARCHDHKFDAITTRDYYALSGFLLSASYRQAPFDTMEHNREVRERLDALAAEHAPRLARSVAQAAASATNRMADFLMTARDALLARPAGAPDGDGLESIARERDLDPVLLCGWIRELEQARSDVGHPFHAYSLSIQPATDPAAGGQAAPGPAIPAPTKDSPTPDTLLAGLIDTWEAQRQQYDAALSAARVLVDFSRPEKTAWLVDGDGFGTRPVRAGELQLSGARVGSDETLCLSAVTGLHTRGAAVWDKTWTDGELASGTQTEAIRVAWKQSGRMLRTETFRLESGRLYYLVRGSGHVYAAVDSHRQNAGPLHQALIREWHGGDEFHWVEHNLTDYAGHRVHIEFSPRRTGDVGSGQSADLAIAMVVEADQPPPTSAPNERLQSLVRAHRASPPRALALAYQELFTAILDRLGQCNVAQSDDPSADAQIADWLVRHPNLFWPPSDPPAVELAEASQTFSNARTELEADIQRTTQTAPTLLEGSGVDECVLVRGNHRTPGELVPRRFLEAAGGAEVPRAGLGSGRLELSRALTDPDSPFLSRVIVNRIWQHLFGRGIVASVDNFGILGEPPTHPELLDYLATRFVRDGWSIKRMIRLLVLSRAYQTSSRPDVLTRQTDPGNRLLSHMPLKRLEGEAIRDLLLAVTGRLERRFYGPGVEVYLTPFMEGRGRPAESGPLDGDGRRSIYIRVRRNFLPSMLVAFDLPTPFTTMGRRGVSNVPAQALTLLNSPLVTGRADRWAQLLLAEQGWTSEDRLRHMYLTLFAREPEPEEVRQALEFLDQQGHRYDASQAQRAWADLCHVLFNVKELIYVR